MSNYIERCQRCGRPFGDGPRKRVTWMRESSRGSGFASDGFSRYYCAPCAEGAKSAISDFEGARSC